jgi:hypothetical protein
MITANQLDYLVRRYTPAADQKCIVCGAPLVLSRSGERGSGPRYNCSSDDASLIRSQVRLSERLDHYARSAWYDRGQADPNVVDLVKAYRELEPRAACPCFDEQAEQQLPGDSRDTRGGETDA